MIYYDTESLRAVLMRWHGSALNSQAPIRALLMALIALGVALLDRRYTFVVTTKDSTAFVDTLTVFNTFLGLMMSFRMNSAFAQWRAGVLTVGTLAETAREIVSSGCSYTSSTIKDELLLANAAKASSPSQTSSSSTTSSTDSAVPTTAGKRARMTNTFNFDFSMDKEEDSAGRERSASLPKATTVIPRSIIERCKFFTELRRLVFLYIAIVFHHCRGCDGVERLKETGMLTPAEYDELHACGAEDIKRVSNAESYQSVVRRTPHKLRAAITELWLKRLVEVACQRGHLSAGNASMLQGKIAQLPTMYTTMFNIANVPIPFNYMQYLETLLLAYMMLYIFVIVPSSGLYTPLWVFMWGTFLFMADEVAKEIECPFGLDPNDIDLEARLLQIEKELTVIIRSQYYFITGGASRSEIPETPEQGSWRQRQTATGRVVQVPPPLGRVCQTFSFHQGCVSPSNGAMDEQESLPAIMEFTTLIDSPTSPNYGTLSAV